MFIERNDLYLHVDKKAKAFDPHEFSAIVKHAKLIFLKRMSVTWGGYSQIALELMMLNRATETHHSYYHYISGVDIPLKTQTEILAFFDEREGREFVEIGEEEDANSRLIVCLLCSKSCWDYRKDWGQTVRQGIRFL